MPFPSIQCNIDRTGSDTSLRLWELMYLRIVVRTLNGLRSSL